MVVLFACMSVAGVAKAAVSTSTDVMIEIEEEVASVANNNKRDATKDKEGVKTGDIASVIGYIVGAVAALGVIAVCVIKKKTSKVFMILAAVLLSFACFGNTSRAADISENVSVTIPTEISVVFDEKGTTGISDFEIKNQSLVPVMFKRITVTECNDWKLVPLAETIPVNTKELAFKMEKQCLKSGENVVDISVSEQSSKKVELEVKRGAWTKSQKAEKALQLEFEYSLGTKAFRLTFDANGGSVSISSMTACNGEKVQLPEPVRENYVFKGWQDEKGNLYNTQFVMPIGNVKLTAKWQETEAYAVYSADDQSLTFYRCDTPILAGSVYNGKNVTTVYTGFETAAYGSAQIPWRSHAQTVTKIEFFDKISPLKTDYWFMNFIKASFIDVRKLDMSNVASMIYMFYCTGQQANGQVIFDGLEDWNVSKVTNMQMSFEYVGAYPTVKKLYMGDLSKWDVSNVTNMMRMFFDVGINTVEMTLSGLEKWNTSNVANMSMMFYQTALYNTTWKLDLRGWNVRKIEYHNQFNDSVEGKVLAPKWNN